jgi:hypothetical protein
MFAYITIDNVYSVYYYLIWFIRAGNRIKKHKR